MTQAGAAGGLQAGAMTMGGASSGEGGAGTAGAGGAVNTGGTQTGEAGAGGSGECQPKSCEELQACGGQVGDGCGAVLQCPACDTCALRTEPLHSQRAKSEGFAGSVDAYFELYDAPCEDVSDCAEACSVRGGSAAMCGASECLEGFPGEPNHCLPATAWRNFDALRAEGQDPPLDGAELVLVYNPYHDRLLADDFHFAIPLEAEITGISVEIRRAADGNDSAVDESVRLIRGGVVGAADRSKPAKWTASFENVTYGGPTDLWGETWTPADINSASFGVALSALYTQGAGNGRAYVDIIRATVHYRHGCE